MSDKMREALLAAKKIGANPHGYTGTSVLVAEALIGQAAHAAALPPGFVAVPVEPTDEMVEAGISAASLNGAEGTDEQLRGDVTGAYAAMIAARPDKQP